MAQLNEGADDDILGTDSTAAPFMPLARVSHQGILWKHPTPAGLCGETAIMNEQHEVGPFAVSPFQELQLRFVNRRRGNESIEAKLHGHSARL